MAPKRKLGKGVSKSNDTSEKAGNKKSKQSPVEETKTEEKGVDKPSSLSNLKIISWNVGGLRAWVKKDGISIFEKEDPDIVCLQEIKCHETKLPPEFTKLRKTYNFNIFTAKNEGYSGVALFSKQKPLWVQNGLNDPVHDEEGRIISAEFDDFYLVTAYVPNAGKKLVTLDKRMDWDPKLQDHLKELNKKKPVIYCGDLNVAHKEIDLANPKTNKRNAGFTQEERDGFSNLLNEGFIDSYRHFYPDEQGKYSFWTYMMNARAKNVGWRLDYFVVSERFIDKVKDSTIKSDVMGSDHCPIMLLVN